MALLQKKLILLRQQRSATDCMQHTCNTHLEDHIVQTMSNIYHMYISACYVIYSNLFDLSLYTFLCSRPHLGKVITLHHWSFEATRLVRRGAQRVALRPAGLGGGEGVWRSQKVRGSATEHSWTWQGSGWMLTVNLKPSGDISEHLVSLGGLGVS